MKQLKIDGSPKPIQRTRVKRSKGEIQAYILNLTHTMHPHSVSCTQKKYKYPFMFSQLV